MKAGVLDVITVCFSFVGDNGDFSVTNDGKIVTKSLLDRETKDSYNIFINVTDHGNPLLQVRTFQ